MNDALTCEYSGKRFLCYALSLALPIAFQNLLTSCASLIDTAMVVGLGNAAVSAMGIATRFSFLLNVMCFGFASGCAALLSQYWGARDQSGVRRSFGLLLCISTFFSLLFAGALLLFPQPLAAIFTDDPELIMLAAGYLRILGIGVPFLVFSQIVCIALRSVERVYIPLVTSAIAVVVNTFLNYCFIEGHLGFPRLGLKGAAIGSISGFFVQTIILVCFLCFRNTPFSGKFSDFLDFHIPFVKQYVKTSLPAFLNEALWALGANVYVMILARQGQENYAGYTLYETVQQIFFVFFVGICGACSVMTGMQVGRGNREAAYKVAKRFTILTPLMGVVLGGLLILTRNPLLRLLPIETEYARTVASACLLFYGFWIAVRMIPYTLICGVFRAGGDTRSGCIFDLFGLYCVGIPVLFVMANFVRPASFVVLVISMFVAEDVLKGILCLRHFRSRKWIRQLTGSPDASR